MNIDDLIWKSLQERRLQHTHEAGKHDKVGCIGPNGLDPKILSLSVQFGTMRNSRKVYGLDLEMGRPFKDSGVVYIAVDGHRFGPLELSCGDGGKYGLGVRARPRSKDHDLHAGYCVPISGFEQAFYSFQKPRCSEALQKGQESDVGPDFLQGCSLVLIDGF